jgi:hypothetical protein
VNGVPEFFCREYFLTSSVDKKFEDVILAIGPRGFGCCHQFWFGKIK